jgi:hypothetical protein
MHPRKIATVAPIRPITRGFFMCVAVAEGCYLLKGSRLMSVRQNKQAFGRTVRSSGFSPQIRPEHSSHLCRLQRGAGEIQVVQKACETSSGYPSDFLKDKDENLYGAKSTLSDSILWGRRALR